MHICLKHVELVILYFQMEGKFLGLTEGVSRVLQEHVVIEVNNLK
jgi:hypothetical protein